MSTKIRPETSKKTEYWIPKHRYYELKHFVMQYDDWKEALKESESSLISPAPTNSDKVQNGAVSDRTAFKAFKSIIFSNNIQVVDKTAKETGKLGFMILRNVIDERSWNERTDGEIASRDEYYKAYRKFFWLLDKHRDWQKVES